MFEDRRWGSLRSALIGAVVAAAVLLSFPAVAAVGSNLILGKPNTADAVTSLSGAANANLRITNAQAEAPALDLRVVSGAPPLRVSSTTRVAKLNADLLDGQHASAFVRTEDISPTPSFYFNSAGASWLANESRHVDANCEPGDIAIAGGSMQVFDSLVIWSSYPIPNPIGSTPTGWRVEATNTLAISQGLIAYVSCVDLG